MEDKVRIIEEFRNSVQESISDVSSYLADMYTDGIYQDVLDETYNQALMKELQEDNNINEDTINNTLKDFINENIAQRLDKDYKQLTKEYIRVLDYNIIRLIDTYKLEGECKFYEVVKTVRMIRNELITLVLEEKVSQYEPYEYYGISYQEEYDKACRELDEVLEKAEK